MVKFEAFFANPDGSIKTIKWVLNQTNMKKTLQRI
jgi:hypothetical protein